MKASYETINKRLPASNRRHIGTNGDDQVIKPFPTASQSIMEDLHNQDEKERMIGGSLRASSHTLNGQTQT
ncbi:hypothetical protein Tco_0624686 [Tanacetum coccineum]|uniref:Uncharacterized protein n=1 Tax=Tanacetum coccineum TaxID=301880 RepID=A0ABQ4WEP0_9ASTR